MKELLGAAVAVVSAGLYDAGYVLEKQALSGMDPLRPTPSGVLAAARTSARWRAGFVAMVAGLGLQVVALTLAPLSVVQPILAGGLVALASLGSSHLGERLDRRHAAALGLVLAGVMAVAVSADGRGRVVTHVPGVRFAVAAVVIGTVGAVVGRAALRGGRRALAGTAVAAGLLYGQGALAEKAVATRLVRQGFVPGAVSSLATAYPWVFAVATLGGMVMFQIGLQTYPASLVASLTNGASTVCALVGSAVVFGEGVLPAGLWSVLRVAGLAAVAGAVVLLGSERGSPRAAVPASSG